MKINFKKISAIATSAIMVGMTMGVAAAANYPAPFVQGGAANAAVVYGTGSGVSILDAIEAGNIQTDLQRYLASSTGATGATTSGETISLDTSATRIWLNTSLNTAKTQLTKVDLPKVLADYTFSGNVDSKLTSTVKLVAGANAGTENSGKVIFGKIPTSSSDPQVGVSLGSSQTSNPLYNASATMAAVNFTHADSEGQPIVLFGQKFTIAASTDTTKIVLLKEAQKLSLDDKNPSATVTIGGQTYTVEMMSASTTSATIKVTDSSGNSDSREISEAADKKVQGLNIAVINADSNNLKLSATIIAGAQKVTLTNGATVTTGDNDDPINGAYAYIVGGTGATTEIAIAVFRPDSSNDAILEGQSFTDPVFGSFKLDFAGLSTPLNSSARDQIIVAPSGDTNMALTMTDDGGNTKTVEFAHNQSSQWFLGDSNNNSIGTIEMANLSLGTNGRKFVVLGNQEYGHLLELYDMYNQTTGSNSITNDRARFRDAFSGDTYDTVFVTTEGQGTLDVEGKRYTVNFTGDGDTAWAMVKYPTTDSAAGEYVAFPTIKAKGNELVMLYQPTLINLTGHEGGHVDVTKLWFPDGDGYTGVAITISNGSANNEVWGFGGSLLNTSQASGANSTTATIGKYIVNFSSTGTANQTKIQIANPESTGVSLKEPGVIIFEGKGDTSTNDYHVIAVDLENAPAGTSNDGVGVSDILFSSPTHWEATRASDSDITDHVDYFGTLASQDSNTASKVKATLSFPPSQTYAQLYMGEKASSVTAGTTGSSGSSTPLGEILVKDSEVSSVATKNLIVVGGSCINSAAATLVGGAFCGADWTGKTGVGAGQFWIKGYATSTLTSSGKVALLVAGYNAADTVNAAKYLRTQVVDTSKAYLGTSATSATLVTSTA
ncbi:MAG: hypothetical protein AABW51_00285 [Nanoarchaeota archaeon]